MNAWIFLLLIGLLLFSALIIGLIVIRKSGKRLKEDLSYAKQAFVLWFVSPLFRLYFWLLEITGKLRINLNGSIPWDEEVLIFAGNHPMPKLQDTFLVPIIIFYLQSKHYLNPIRYFPVTLADKKNFGTSKFFAIVGRNYIIEVDRTLVDIKGKVSRTYEKIKKRVEEFGGGIFVFYSEGGRTASAEKYGKTIRESPEGNKLATPLGKGAAHLSLDTGAPIILFWSSLSGNEPSAKPNPITAIAGLIELLLNPWKKAMVDIGHPDGPLRPEEGENVEELSQRTEDSLLELGDYQTRRSRRGKK